MLYANKKKIKKVHGNVVTLERKKYFILLIFLIFGYIEKVEVKRKKKYFINQVAKTSYVLIHA